KPGPIAVSTPFILGWEEWLALPDLGLPAIKAKVDTGARTSALHAFSVETFGPAEQPKVRFGVHPIPGRDDVQVFATADIVDKRDVTSSNGESETRIVIRTRARMGEREWPIEITLTNRETMAYRMLLGRQAIQDDMVVEPGASFRQPRLNYRAYGLRAAEPEERRALSIALMTRRPDNATNRRLVRAAERRGHRVVIIDRTRASIWMDARDPALFIDGKPVKGIDAVVVRAGRSPGAFSLAIVRQLEIMGALSLPTSSALTLMSDPLAVRQTLARHRVNVPEAAVSHADFLKSSRGEAPVLADTGGALGKGPLVRFAVIGGRALAAIERERSTALEPEPPWRPVELAGAIEPARREAEAATRALRLGLASVDIAQTRQGPVVLDVTASLSIASFERLTGAALVEALIVYLEREAEGRPAAPSPASD
ncbi:MAG TPA: RimK/LysX family protein, partial [Hyphomicrobiaceae bacterium]|nr:RimK/LysX family protein [Hyphomicrobiaceae bacterium]